MTGDHQQDLFDKQPAPWELDDQSEQAVAAVLFSEPPHGPYDYRVPDALRGAVRAGVRVGVPLGRGNRRRTGYCVGVETRKQPTRPLKSILAVEDAQPLLSPAMLRLTAWMSDHYLCPWGQVLDAVVPSGVRGQAGTREQLFVRVPAAVVARMSRLELPEKQAQVLRTLAAAPEPMTLPDLARAAGCTQAPIQALRRAQLIVAEVRRVQQAVVDELPIEPPVDVSLNSDQQGALDGILEPLRAGQHATILIHGVTGSGKTEVYIRAIQEVIQYGRQAIVLVPEISLTPQTRRRFRSRFERVAVLHSHLSPAERHWHWRQIAGGNVQVVVGARSAVFAPAPNLGLIVLDEEHDASFKQDTAPRYHARDVALRRAQAESIPLVLGSATPSLESWHEAWQGRFRLVEMPRRVSHLPLPDVATIDLRAQYHNRRSRGAISRPLHLAVHEALRDGGQVILLLNRRGFSTTIQCPGCGFVVKCPDCDIALTHHRQGEKAVCHYCDYTIPPPPDCPECRFEGIRYSGLGTQKLELEVRTRFPDVACLRMDSDSMVKPGSHEEALDRFRAGDVKILVGTQMIAKGLDFPNVTLVGVINADTALHFPDFRAAERTFQLVTQVAGRTGRGPRGGRVLVQTFSPEHPAIIAAQRHDYVTFANGELPVRREFGYPPMTAMIRIVVRGPSETTTEQFAESVARAMRQQAAHRGVEGRILGPVIAPIPKLRGNHRFHILLYHTDGQSLRDLVRAAVPDLKPPEGIHWIVDVDPL
ncbi:MAG: primosomal protein N', partial [Planctomycetes bacterium]|nr:primosomal protein N' [Planctomycetota bacterium]